MNITQLRYVLTASKCSSMREAAGKLYVTQPALSLSIRDLEEELGITIFGRSTKGITLTAEGQEFVRYAKKAIGPYTILEDKYLSGNQDKIHFSVSTQHYNFAIKSFVRVISADEPNKYEFSIYETKIFEVLENVRDMKSEVGVISFSKENEKLMKKLLRDYKLVFVPLMVRDTYAYFWKEHPLANRENVSLKELNDYPCIVFDQNNNSDFYISEEAMGNYDFRKLIKSDDRATSMELIATLNGYSIGSGMLAEDDVILKGLVSVKLEEEDSLTIGYIIRKGSELSDYGKKYTEELLKYKELE